IPTAKTPEPLGPIDVVLPILHGPFGEDGTVQGLLELADVAYVGAGVLASALCMDKDVFKRVMRDQGIPVAEHIALRLGDAVRNPFGYPSKYDEGGSDLLVPPPGLTEAQVERAQRLAVQAYVATECEGMARADFFVRETDGEIVMNELNTIPGFTPTSFYTRLFEASGWTYAHLLDRLIELALERYE